MKKDIFLRLLKSTLNNLITLTQTKGEEYARSEDDQLANFRRQANEFGMSMEQVLGIYLNKHLDSIKFHIKNPGVELAEPIEGRIDDAILYLILLKAIKCEGHLSNNDFDPT